MKKTHKYTILEKLYKTGLKLTATDFHYISNANQFMVELENQNLITSEWGVKGEARVKLRFVNSKQMKRAKAYLEGTKNTDSNEE